MRVRLESCRRPRGEDECAALAHWWASGGVSAGRGTPSASRYDATSGDTNGNIFAAHVTEPTVNAQFALLRDTRRSVAELMAECAVCGALTIQDLVAAWHLGYVMCSECGVQSRVTTAVLYSLWDQAIGAVAEIDRLMHPARA